MPPQHLGHGFPGESPSRVSGVQYPADVRDPGVRVGAPQQNVPDRDALPLDHEGEGMGATVQIGFRFVCDGFPGGAGCVPRVFQQIAGHVRLRVPGERCSFTLTP